MNRKRYTSDPRYSKVLDNMDLLGIMDITTTRQDKNGTIVWKLPIKNAWKNGKLIEVASFETGYVRNNNSASSNYQLNKRCEGEPQYYEMKIGKGTPNNPYETVYRKFTTRSCVLIPIEIERLEYLISYCLKNYYIKRANEVADGKLIPKWKLENSISACDNMEKRSDYYQNHYEDAKTNYTMLQEKLDKTRDKYKKLDEFYEASKAFDDSMYEGRDIRVKELEKEVQDLKGKLERSEFYPFDLQVLVNGQRYKVI